MSSETQVFLDLFAEGETTDLMREVVRRQFEQEMIICDGFYMSTSHKDDLKYAIPEGKLEQYRDQFLIIAEATHSGSSMGFYRAPGTNNVDEYPVVIFGDEGGVLVLAEGFKNYLAFATLNVSPYINTWSEGPDSFDLTLGEPDWENDDFVQWIATKGVLVLKTLEEANTQIIEPAQAKYQAAIDAIFDFGH